MANCHLAPSTASMQDSWAVISDVTGPKLQAVVDGPNGLPCEANHAGQPYLWHRWRGAARRPGAAAAGARPDGPRLRRAARRTGPRGRGADVGGPLPPQLP